jgi:hypothetical protein
MSIKKLAPASRMPVRHTALAVAVAMGFGFSGNVLAQSTTGTIFGQAPVAAGETVQIVGGSGFNRTIPVDKSGRYSITLPVGIYDVTLTQNGQAVQTKKGVTALAAQSVSVDFVTATGANASNTENLSSVMVTANAIPPIDVSSTQESTVITSEQLKNLPLARTGAAIALLAPGTVQGASALGGGPTGEPLVSFGGSSVVENAYYINGFNTTDPLSDSGGITLPYGAIAQQETLTNGYGPEYGRSTGGVISQVGASGTNTWHFGGAVFWQPEGVQGTQGNVYYANPAVTTAGQTPGTLYGYRNGNTSWEQIYDAYVGGPLIKDKLFFFLAAEAEHHEADEVAPNVGTPYEYQNSYSDPKYYAKLDWNITDSNILSLTSIGNKEQYNGSYYDFDYGNRTEGDLAGYQPSFKNSFNINILKFTSYITDDLTLNAMIGKLDGTYYTSQPGAASDLPSIINPYLQSVDGVTPNNGAGYSNSQIYADVSNPAHKSEETNFRIDLAYKLGDHTLAVGIDNQTTRDTDDGSIPTGPGYAWIYQSSALPGVPIEGSTAGVAPYVAPISGANFVTKYTYITSASVQVKQYAQYIKDTWQVTPNLLLNIGLRNDQFTNYNPNDQPYVRLTKPQWAPRLGFSWDIMGDSSMKLFGNAGRYYMALPTGVALREASASTYVQEYYTYTGVTSTGIPTGLTPIYSCGQGCGYGVPVSANNEYGQQLDPGTVAATNLKASYQDSFVLGFQHQFAPNWDYGVTATWTKLNNIIDDTGEGPLEICNALLAQNPGLLNQPVNPSPSVDCGPSMDVNASILINPGSTETYRIKNLNGGYATAVVSPEMLGFPPAFRNYYSLEMFLEHVWDGKWSAKLDYVYSKSYGTSEGPVESNIGQGGTSQSATEAWDYTQIMSYSNGLQANNRKHVLKGYGTYAITPEWSVSAVLQLASGTPVSCLGLYGPEQSNPGLGYGAGSYHWCGGVPTPSGTTGFTPWIHTLDLALQYRPLWADKKLAFQVQIRNVTNEQKVTQEQSDYGSTISPNQTYKAAWYSGSGVFAVEQPRTIQFGVTYDW